MHLADHFDRGVVRGVIAFAKSRPDWQLFGPGWMFPPLDDLSNWHGHGVIARIEDLRTADLLSRSGMPVVDVAGAFPQERIATVRNDDAATGSVVGDYLAGRGLRNFAFFGVTGTVWSELREEGLRRAVGEHAMKLHTFNRPLDWWKTPGESPEVARFVASLPPVTGVLACNDATALKVLSGCRAAGRLVPDEIAVVGVDNEDIVCELALPALTSVELNLEDIGRRAAAELDAAIQRGSAAANEKPEILIPPRRLFERESSRTFPTSDPVVRDALRLMHMRAADASLTTDTLAREVAVSRRSLESRFRRETGETIHHTLVGIRMRLACTMLRETRLKISAIAGQSGFGSESRFFQSFRTRMGMTPGEYRGRNPAHPTSLRNLT
jgi:LacI family transcriptional regulator